MVILSDDIIFWEYKAYWSPVFSDFKEKLFNKITFPKILDNNSGLSNDIIKIDETINFILSDKNWKEKSLSLKYINNNKYFKRYTLLNTDKEELLKYKNSIQKFIKDNKWRIYKYILSNAKEEISKIEKILNWELYTTLDIVNKNNDIKKEFISNNYIYDKILLKNKESFLKEIDNYLINKQKIIDVKDINVINNFFNINNEEKIDFYENPISLFNIYNI